MSFYIASQKVLVGNELLPRAVLVRNGRIESIDSIEAATTSGIHVEDYGDLIVMAGLVDSHVHINEPGKTDWEGFWTATRAAAAGGVTTIIDMPLNSIPVTTTVSALIIKANAMRGQLWVDVGLLGGVVPGNVGELCGLVDGGVMGFKCFMTHSGLDEFPGVSESDIALALETLHSYNKGGVLMFHAEDDKILNQHQDHHGHSHLSFEGARSYQRFLETRPKALSAAEDVAIEAVIQHVRATPYPCHIVHLASSSSVEALRAAQAEGLPISVETTFHYLHFEAEKIPDGATLFKCCPPIRDKDNREKLWDALKSGVIAQVISDHSPCTPNLKHIESGSFSQAWGGIGRPSLGLPIMWTECRARGLSVADISRWCSKQTAELVGLNETKGQLLPGYDADIVVWDPNSSFEVTKDQLRFKNRQSPYEATSLFGVVQATYLRGHLVFANGSFSDEGPTGRRLVPDRQGDDRIKAVIVDTPAPSGRPLRGFTSQ